MHPRRRTAVAALLVAAVALIGPAALATTVTAQELPACMILSCSFEVATVSWNGTGEPGSFLAGTIRITNTGQSQDAYDITVSSDNETWTAEVDPATTAMVPGGSSPLPGGGNNTADIQVRVHVPEDARAGESATIRVTVTSKNDDDLDAEDITLATEALQIHAWGLSCTDETTIRKTQSDTIELIATNLGNGRDTATITTTPLNGLTVGNLTPLNVAAHNTTTRQVELGVGIALDDGDYSIRWDLAGGGGATATCTTTLTVTGGEGGGDDGDGDSEDSPLPGAMLLIVGVTALAAWRRRERDTA